MRLSDPVRRPYAANLNRFWSRKSIRFTASPTKSLRGAIVKSGRRRLLRIRADIAAIAAVAPVVPLARTEEIEPAHLEAPAEVIDTVQDQPMELMRDRVAVFVAKIWRHVEGHLIDTTVGQPFRYS